MLQYGSAIALVGGLMLLGAPAQSAIVSADFKELLDLPNFGSSGPRVLQSLNKAVGAGAELTEADEIANPSNWEDSLLVDLDPVGNTVTLTRSSQDVYQTISITITNIQFSALEQIVDFSLVSDTLFSANSDPYTITTAFTADSLTVDISVDDPQSFDTVEFGPGSILFNIALRSGDGLDVPEPMTLALLASAALGLVTARGATNGRRLRR